MQKRGDRVGQSCLNGRKRRKCSYSSLKVLQQTLTQHDMLFKKALISRLLEDFGNNSAFHQPAYLRRMLCFLRTLGTFLTSLARIEDLKTHLFADFRNIFTLSLYNIASFRQYF